MVWVWVAVERVFVFDVAIAVEVANVFAVGVGFAVRIGKPVVVAVVGWVINKVERRLYEKNY